MSGFTGKIRKKPHLDTLWRTISQINEAFSHLGIIWCEIINHIKRLEREWTNSVSLFFRRIEK